MNAEDKHMFQWVMTWACLVGGLIWLLAFADLMTGNSWANTQGPLVGIPLGLVFWGVLFYFICGSTESK